MLSLLRELFKFARVYRKFWMVPAVIFFLLFGGLLVFVESSALAPFIYALF